MVARLDDVAHYHAADLRGVQRRTPERFAHDGGAKLGGRRVLQAPVEGPDRGSNGMRQHYLSL